MGWNQLQLKKPENRLFRGIAPLSYVYFCHSYFVKPKDVKSAAATTDYGGEFVSAIAVDNIYGVQFHPEKARRSVSRSSGISTIFLKFFFFSLEEIKQPD